MAAKSMAYRLSSGRFINCLIERLARRSRTCYSLQPIHDVLAIALHVDAAHPCGSRLRPLLCWSGGMQGVSTMLMFEPTEQ